MIELNFKKGDVEHLQYIGELNDLMDSLKNSKCYSGWELKSFYCVPNCNLIDFVLVKK